MAKQSGLGSQFYVAQYDLSGDVGELGAIRGGRSPLTTTAINALAEERILGLRSGDLSFSGFWNTTAGQIKSVLDDMPSADLLATLAIPTTASAFAVGDPAASINAKQATFDQTRGQDGSLTVASQLNSTGYPLEWGQLLTTGKQTYGTGTVNGASIDFGSASTLFGAAAYLHVISIASGTGTFKVQDSADDSSFTDVTGMTFTNVTAATSERVQGAVDATVRRYVRFQGSGVHGDAVVVCNFVRYRESQAT